MFLVVLLLLLLFGKFFFVNRVLPSGMEISSDISSINESTMELPTNELPSFPPVLKDGPVILLLFCIPLLLVVGLL